MSRIVIIAALLGAACTTAVPPQLAAGDLQLLLSVPAPVRRTVGPYAANLLESLLAYHGSDLDPETLPAARDAASISGNDLRDAIVGHGLAAFVVHGSPHEGPLSLATQLGRGRPILTLVEDDRGDHRWCLVVGYDDRIRIVVTQDPLARLLAFPIDAFAREWARTKNLMVLAAVSNPP